MLNPPGGRELLDMALGEERKLADPKFKGQHRYRLALLARAQEIAARDAALGPDLWREELALLRALYGIDDRKGGDADAVQHALYTLNTRLAADLRSRRLAAQRQGDVGALLETQVRARLAITNPRYLETVYSHE